MEVKPDQGGKAEEEVVAVVHKCKAEYTVVETKQLEGKEQCI